MGDAAKISKQLTYSVYTMDNRKKKVKKIIHLSNELVPIVSMKKACYQLRFIYNLGKLAEVSMEDLRSGEITTISGNVLNHFLDLPRQTEEQFQNRKKELLSGKSSLKNKKLFMLNCIKYLD